MTFAGPPGEETLEITNVSYEVTGSSLPGLPEGQRLLLRKTAKSRQHLDEIGVDAATTLDTWPFPGGLDRQPLYSLTVAGTEGRVFDGVLYVVSRGLEEVEWWSVYKLGTAERLFDTYTPLLAFSISRKELTQRYVGLEVPPDDVADPRLQRANVVAVVTYASAVRVIREALLTCDDPRRAKELRSYSDTSRAVALAEISSPETRSAEPRRIVRISFQQQYPSAPKTLTVAAPISGDDLDLTHALLPPGLHISAWKR